MGDIDTPEFRHETVLADETVSMMNLKEGDLAIDCTLGGGGHTERILRVVGPKGKVIGFDRDETAVAATTRRLSQYVSTGNLEIIQTEFSAIRSILSSKNINGQVAGICADIGVSSPQLDDPERGFSFLREGPLDMRMDKTKGMSARDFLQSVSFEDLTRILRDYGEEPKARILAKLLIEERAKRPFNTTTELADFISENLHYPGPSRKHLATRTFQALRIAVNGELDELDKLLNDAFAALKTNGRLAVISFHSLEDRMVKSTFTKLASRDIPANMLRNMPITQGGLEKMYPAKAEIIRPFPVQPSDSEIERNPRARSARLRVLEKR